MAVPLFDTRTPLAPLREALARQGRRGARRRPLHPRPRGRRLRGASSREHLGTPSVVGVANGTDALVLALRAMGVGPGDDVVVPSFTFYASAEAIALIGANPVFCDVDPRDVLRHARHRARGADRRRRRSSWPCTCSATSRPSRRSRRSGCRCSRTRRRRPARARPTAAAPARSGTAATFSFFPSKNLGAFGDGGADRDRRRRRSPRRVRDAALPRLARQGVVRARRPQLPPRRAAGRAAAARAAAARRLVRRPPRRGRRTTPRRGLGRARARCPSPSTAAIPPGTCT